jgi:syntaxin 8
LAARYEKLLEQYMGDNGKVDSELVYLPGSGADTSSSTRSSTQTLKATKSVRFRDKLVDEEPTAREEQFITPYKDDEVDPRETGYTDSSSQEMYLEQQQMMRDQDEHLDRLASSVSRQHELSIQIDDELGSQIELVDELDTLTDRSHANLETAKRRLDKFSRAAKENGSMLTIGILVVLFLILVIVL